MNAQDFKEQILDDVKERREVVGPTMRGEWNIDNVNNDNVDMTVYENEKVGDEMCMRRNGKKGCLFICLFTGFA